MIDSVNAPTPVIQQHRFAPGGTCAYCGQFWPCQGILAQADMVSRTVPTPTGEARLFEELKTEHYTIHPDHEKTPVPQNCSSCAAIAAYRDIMVRTPVLTPAYVTCSECGLPLANKDLLAEHQATVHEMTEQTEADIRQTTIDAPLEETLTF